MQKINLKNLGSGVFFLFFSVFIYSYSFKIIVTVHDAMGPRFFPQLISICMGILSIILIINSFKAKIERDKKTKNLSSMLGTFLILICYALLLDKIGFIILTTIYLFLQILLLLPKDLLKVKKYIFITAIVSIIVPISLYFLFYRVFGIFLPMGILG